MARPALFDAMVPARPRADDTVGCAGDTRWLVHRGDRPPALGNQRNVAHRRRSLTGAGDNAVDYADHVRLRVHGVLSRIPHLHAATHSTRTGRPAGSCAAIGLAEARSSSRDCGRAAVPGGGEAAMNLPLLSALFMLFALGMYVVLDGFDLGVGALLFAQPDQRTRDRMVDAIAPTWDGNETWLVMAGITLLAGFSIAYGILIPAFCIPITAMVVALGLRGVSFEFRHNSTKLRRRWDAVFAGGSLVAGLAQGVIIGGGLQRVNIERNEFVGSPLDTFSLFTVLTGVTVVAGYATLGVGWLRLKGEDATRAFARKHQRWIPLAFLGLTILSGLIAATVQPSLVGAWPDHRVALSWCFLAFIVCAL